MANYNNLKTAIQAVIKANGNQEITGEIMQNALLSMINSLGTGYQFMGIATPETNPSTPDQKVFYIATGKGTYANFGGLIVDEDEVVLLIYDDTWKKLSSGIALKDEVSLIKGNLSNRIDISKLDVGSELIIFTKKIPTEVYVNRASGRIHIGTIDKFSFANTLHYVKQESDLSLYIYSDLGNYDGWVIDAPSLMQIFKEIEGVSVDNNNKVDISLSINLANNAKSELGKYIADETGIFVDNPVFNVTDFIPCKPNTTYYAAKNDKDGFTRCICYDENHNVIKTSYNVSVGASYTTSDNASYMKLTYFAENQSILQVSEFQADYVPYSPIGGYLKDIYKEIEKFKQSDFMPIFDNWGFIGDSLTSGFLTVPNVDGVNPLLDSKGGLGRNIYRLSWGQILCKKYGVRGTNFSVGGITAKEWVLQYPFGDHSGYSNETNQYNVNFTSDKKTSYTICLGTNDVINETDNPLGSISDIDINNKENNADTFYGNYAKIIQYCRELCPSCKIFLITPMKEWSIGAETKGYNDAVRQICKLFKKCYLIDLAKSKEVIAEQYNYEAHPTSIGYSYVANLIANSINAIVANNMTDFIFQGAIESLKDGYDDGNY